MADDWTGSVTDLTAAYTTTVRAEDIARFAELSGDDYEAHTDPKVMAGSAFGGIIAHGALLVGYMSAAGTRAIRVAQDRGNRSTPVALGYERMRFVAPVFPGDTVTVSYTVTSVDSERHRSLADIAVTTQSGATVAVAEHIMKWLPNTTD